MHRSLRHRVRTAKGHEERFPPPTLRARYGFRKETISGIRRNGRDAPKGGPLVTFGDVVLAFGGTSQPATRTAAAVPWNRLRKARVRGLVGCTSTSAAGPCSATWPPSMKRT